ncbi:choice-of-anchor L domain-containing protein, partial [Flavobacterium terrae]
MKKLYLLFLLFFVFFAQAQLTVNNTQTPAQLVQNALVGNGVTPFNIKFNGSTVNANVVRDQVGEFTTNFNPTNLGLDRGLIMTTGKTQVALGPNNVPGASSPPAFPFVGDPDLYLSINPPGTQPINIKEIDNVAVLEFDFLATGPSLRFDYVFASEEYPDYVNASFNDTFGFFLSGPGISGPYSGSAINIALIPNTAIPVSINTVNNGLNNSGVCTNCAYYYNNSNIGVNPTTWNPAYTVQYDGFTRGLSAQAELLCGQVYHIKLAIANVEDDAFDSAVFLKDFEIEPMVLTDGSGADSYLGCEGSVIINSGLSPTGNTFVWTQNTNVMTGVNTPSITVTEPGNYQLSVYNSTGCLIAQDDIDVTYYTNPLIVPQDLVACTTATGPPYTYDINQNTYMLDGQSPSDFSFVYHSGSATGPVIPNGNLAAYSSTGTGESIWVVIEDLNNTGCTFETSFLLNTTPGPSGSFSYASSSYCESITTPVAVTLSGLTSG